MFFPLIFLNQTSKSNQDLEVAFSSCILFQTCCPTSSQLGSQERSRNLHKLQCLTPQIKFPNTPCLWNRRQTSLKETTVTSLDDQQVWISCSCNLTSKILQLAKRTDRNKRNLNKQHFGPPNKVPESWDLPKHPTKSQYKFNFKLVKF